MRKLFILLLLFLSQIASAQVDFSDSWEDFFSYNNVKDFVIVDDVIYALSDNAVFTYNIVTEETQKLSSVQAHIQVRSNLPLRSDRCAVSPYSASGYF